MEILPFYGLYYKGTYLNREDMDVCEEFGGDCYEFAMKYLKFEWLTDSYTAGSLS